MESPQSLLGKKSSGLICFHCQSVYKVPKLLLIYDHQKVTLMVYSQICLHSIEMDRSKTMYYILVTVENLNPSYKLTTKSDSISE